jgi:uncharacterized membrane protein YeaQ/YmgE (transglycosylase-associated protein family)
MNILLWVILGAVAGWIADMIMKSDHGVVEDVILGVVGAFVGGFILNFLGQSGVTGFNIYSLIVAVIGAVVLIFLGRLIHK